jgi:hypothetical protein
MGAADLPLDERRRITIEICARIAAGESTRAILDGDKRPEGWPSRTLFWRWRCADEEIAATFLKAWRDRVLLQAEEIIDLADEPPRLAEGKVDQGWEAWRRQRIDTRKWNAARMHSALFGDRTILAGDADSPLHVEVADPKAALLRGLTPKPAGDGESGEGSEP